MAFADGETVGPIISTAFIVGERQEVARRLRDEQGQGLVEYALMLLFVAVVAVAVIAFLGPEVSDAITRIGQEI